MQRRGSSPTTIVWAVLLLGVLFLVGKTVTAPPPGPPPPPKATPVGSTTAPAHRDLKAVKADMKKSFMAEQQKMMGKMHGKAKPYDPHKFDPNAIQVDSGYFSNFKEGRKGEEDLQARVAAAKAEQEKEKALNSQPAPSAPPPVDAAPKTK